MTRMTVISRLVVMVLAVSILMPAVALAQAPFVELSGHLSVARRLSAAAALDDGRLLIAGGIPGLDNAGSAITLTEIHDPATGLTTTVAPLPFARSSAQAIRFPDGRIGVFGGVGTDRQALRDVTIYDAQHDRWAPGSPLPEAMRGPNLALLADGNILVVGSLNAYRYDPATDQFSSAGTMLSAHDGGGIGVLSDGRVMVAGGIQTSIAQPADIYDPASNSWTATGDTTRPSYDDSYVIPLQDGGAIHVTRYSGVERYDALLNTWTEAALKQASPFYAQVMWIDGRIIAAGGTWYGSYPDVADTAIYDPANDAWSIGPAMHAGHAFDRPVALGPGRYAVFGYARFPTTAIEIVRTNHAPIADAGPDFVAYTCGGCAVRVDGNASTDQDRDPLTYSWYRGGSLLLTTSLPIAGVLLDEGVHSLTLKVQDSYGGESEDTVVVTVTGPGNSQAETIAALQRRVGELDNQVLSLNDEVHALLTERATLQSQKQALEDEVHRLLTENATLRNDKTALQAETAALLEQLTLLLLDNVALQARLDAVSAEKVFVDGKLAACTAERAEGASTIDSLEAALQRALGDATFQLPGATTTEQLRALVVVITGLNRGHQQAIYKELGGKIK